MMNMTEKMTLMDQINAIAFEGLTEDQFDFLVDRARKSVRKASAKKGMTKAQKENVGIKAEILDVLASADAGMTATAIGNALGVSCQKASALLAQMVDDGDVVRTKEGKANVFTLQVEDTDEDETETE